MPELQQLTISQARLLALLGQGFLGEKPKTVLDVLKHTNLLQIDTVNVFERAHYLPIFSRMGPFPKVALDDLTRGSSPSLVEYWAHEAAILPMADLPLFSWRRKQFRDEIAKKSENHWVNQNRDLMDWVLDEIREKGAMTASEIEHDRNKAVGTWWGWSDVKIAIEWLFRLGEVNCASRKNFSRVFDLPERILPSEILKSEIDEVVAKKILLLRAARSYGVATARDLFDYFRMPFSANRHLIDELVEDGTLVELKVEDWPESAFADRSLFDAQPAQALVSGRDHEAQVALKQSPTTVLSPFDPMVWYRPRAERLYDFHYRIEIYTPLEKRQFGYYSLPVLHRGRIAGRLDLKNDRKAKVLLVQSAWHEPWLSPKEITDLSSALKRQLELAAAWQDCDRVLRTPRGNLSEFLSAQAID